MIDLGNRIESVVGVVTSQRLAFGRTPRRGWTW